MAGRENAYVAPLLTWVRNYGEANITNMIEG
jgi:hypothetical protein